MPRTGSTQVIFVLSAAVLWLLHAHGHSAVAAVVPITTARYALRNCTKEQLQQVANYSAVTELTAEHCQLPTLENAFFIRFHGLVALEITDSGLTTLEDYALHGLRHLKTLSLAHNNISAVQSWSNEQMSALIAFDLRRNAIRQLTLKSFHRYPNLQRLNLAANLLEDIDDGIFRWMPHLKYLNLGRNRIKSIEARNFHGMHRLMHLALHNNQIAAIEPDSFQTNKHLRSLHLEGNQLIDLEFMTAQHLVRLVHLNLSHNALETLHPLTFANGFELVSLDLSYNRLVEIVADTFPGLESLERLNMSHNILEQIEPQGFHRLMNLEWIDLSSNNLSQLPGELFASTSMMQHIDLAQNMLVQINETLFSGMPYLTHIDLNGNRLHADGFVGHLADELDRAELTLLLNNNAFQTINMSRLLELSHVELAGNHWRCGWLIEQVLRAPAKIRFGRDYEVSAQWSANVLQARGLECFDEGTQRNIIVLDTSGLGSNTGQQQQQPHSKQNQAGNMRIATPTDCSLVYGDGSNPAPPPIVWPKIRVDKFDSRSVIIWMLIAIAIAFSALRVGQQFVEQTERKKRLSCAKQEHMHLMTTDEQSEELQQLKSTPKRATENDRLSSVGHSSLRNSTRPK